MRIIKFRAWDNQQKMMRDDWRTFGTENGLLEIMQFTGLFDRSGKEIYEGDIVRWTYTNSGKEMIAEVQWKGVGFKPTRLSDRNTFEMKIIGNIYENPELTK